MLPPATARSERGWWKLVGLACLCWAMRCRTHAPSVNMTIRDGHTESAHGDASNQATSSPSVSVWIVNYKSAAFLHECLSSLSSPLVRSIFILDNASPGDEVRLLRQLAQLDTRIRLIEETRNVGFGGGHNAISKAATREDGEIVWLLNPDTIVAPAAVERLVSAIEHLEADIVSPAILTGVERERIWHCGGTIDTRSGEVTDSLVGRDPAALDAAPIVLASTFLSGAAPMMRRDTWDALGGFDERLFLYWEDVELCLRATRFGYRLAARTDARIWHVEGGSSKSDRRGRSRVYYLASRNRVLVCRENWWQGWSLVVGYGAPVFARLVGYAAFRGGRGHVSRAVATVWGAICGASAPTRSDRRPIVPSL